ncbi:hypothetical protein [Streptomyces sp. NBC_00414]|uniref:hypothetical protein n=1 Tax=Streptomyces sp. NBC_00414 TaxID=2975739 RepID=UPI002E1F719E
MPSPSRRNVLATGSAVGGAAFLTAGLPAQASAAGLESAPIARTVPTVPTSAISDPWRTVLDDADLVWQRMPKTWYEGPFLGNGFLGSGIYAEPGRETEAVRFNVQHSEVQDHRPRFGSLFGLARLPIGHFTLEPVGAITGLDLRLGLRDAELTGTLTTDRGTLAIRALVHTTRSVLAVEVTPSRGERDFRWVFRPAEAISPRAAFKPLPEGYTGNPPAGIEEHDGVSAAVQPLLSGGQHVTAWRERTHGSRRTLYVHVTHSYPRATARGRALAAVRKAARLPYDGLAVTHRSWWHAAHAITQLNSRSVTGRGRRDRCCRPVPACPRR